MLRNQARLAISNWRGLDSFNDRKNLSPESWFDSDNVLVSATGGAEALRSPDVFSDALLGSGSVHGLIEYKRSSGHVMITDRGTASYVIPAAGTVTALRTGQAGTPWTSLTINDRLHRIDGSEFVQVLNDLTSVYRNGIDAPTVAPVLTYTGGAPDVTINISLQCSYCYYNAVTGHISAPSPLSNVLAPGADFSVNVAVTASIQTGVSDIIFFFTVDGGNVPYLISFKDGSGPVSQANSTSTAVIQLGAFDWDTLTPEPIYNKVPPTSATSMFEHENRLFLIVDGALQYSGYESTTFGRQEESWPTLNQLVLKNDRAIGGISTAAGALIFGKSDCHLLSGSISDKTSGPASQVAVTEKLKPFGWNIGIAAARTAVSTPFGPIWTDNTKRIRNWSLTDQPIEIAQALRHELDGMTAADMEAAWFQHGKNGGYYVLSDKVKTLFVLIYQTDGKLQFGYGKTSLAMLAVTSCTFEKERFFFATNTRIKELLDPDLQGSGWADGTEIYLKLMLGNDGNFSYLHSLSLDGDSIADVTASVAKADGTVEEDLSLSDDTDTGEAVYGLIDREGRRHILKLAFPSDDENHREVISLQIFLQNKRRAI